MSRPSALSINVLLIFDIHDIDGALFLNVSILFTVLARLLPATLIHPFTAIYCHINLILVLMF